MSKFIWTVKQILPMGYSIVYWSEGKRFVSFYRIGFGELSVVKMI